MIDINILFALILINIAASFIEGGLGFGGSITLNKIGKIKKVEYMNILQNKVKSVKMIIDVMDKHRISENINWDIVKKINDIITH